MAYTSQHDIRSIIAGLVFGIVLFALFFKLTIQVTDNFVHFSIGIGLIHGKYKIEDIESCKPLNYVPFGWGIRIRPGAILFNVAGNKAVELSIKGKKRKVWLGTNKPDDLSAYIQSKLKSTN